MNRTMLGKPPTNGRYYCTECFNIFELEEELQCPACCNNTREDFVLIYVREVAEEILMHTAADYHGG